MLDIYAKNINSINKNDNYENILYNKRVSNMY